MLATRRKPGWMLQRAEPLGPTVLVGCPDARPPAYQAVIGLDKVGQLDRFMTSFYHKGPGLIAGLVRRLLPGKYAAYQKRMRRRNHRKIPTERVISRWDVDVSLVAETRLARPMLRRALARRRTERFDHQLAQAVQRHQPEVCFTFSDVGSRQTMALCRQIGIRTILSMVTGDVREEREVLAREAERAPEFLPIYLGDGKLDRIELDWLHARRLAEIEVADLILVPSDHIAETLVRYGTDRQRIKVVPYAADTRGFRPIADKVHTDSCTFLFAGGITQRKGIKDLLDAWRLIRRPGWRLQLLGALPNDPGPLRPYLGDVELLGRVGHAEVAAHMARADVFVFPSLFEGSAVVTYEALASGLPAIVTPNAGSVVRDGEDGMIVPAADHETLAAAMERLGTEPELRALMARSARERALQFDWSRYHASIRDAVEQVVRAGIDIDRTGRGGSR